jgi:hypothetical protein
MSSFTILKRTILVMNYFMTATISAHVQNQAQQNLVTPIVPSPPTTLDSIYPSFLLAIRASTSTVIDLNTMPDCVQSSCLVSSAEILACPPIEAPCPSSASNGSTCTTYDASCYCALTTPMLCAWSCSWWDWMLAEDWFAESCPEAKPIDYSGLPNCAQSCVENNAFDYGCITAGKNCFCAHGSLFSCETKCKKEADQTSMLNWYADQCDVPLATASNALDGSSSSEQRTPAWSKIQGRKLHWYEIMAIVVAVMTFVILGAGLGILALLGSKTIHKKASPKTNVRGKAKASWLKIKSTAQEYGSPENRDLKQG